MAAIVLEPPKFTPGTNPIVNDSEIYYLDVNNDPGRIFKGRANTGVITYGPGDTQPYRFYYENYIQNRTQGHLERNYENQTQVTQDARMVEYNEIVSMLDTALKTEAAATLTTMKNAGGARRRKSRRKSKSRKTRR